MLLEVIISLAIILSFVANLLWIDHPDTGSYTLYFVLSLLLIAPFPLAWKFWKAREVRETKELEVLAASTPVSVSGDLEVGMALLNMETLAGERDARSKLPIRTETDAD